MGIHRVQHEFHRIRYVDDGVMKALHLDSLLGVQLAMLAVGSCIGALVFGTRELKGSRWRHMITFLAIITVGFFIITCAKAI